MDAWPNESDGLEFEDEGRGAEPAPRAYVFYHAGCADGFGAAWAAWKTLGDGVGVIYRPVQYGHQVPWVEYGATVYVLDFSWPAAELLALADRCERLVVLDHHKTAEAALAHARHEKMTVTFDMAKSGAVLAWEHFFPGEPVPTLLRYVQDRDLWAWNLPDSRAFSAALRAEAMEFWTWDCIANAFDSPDEATFRENFLNRGRAIVSHVDSVVEGLCDKAFWTRIAGHNVPAVNSQGYQSEIGDALCGRFPDAPFAAIWYGPDMTSRIWSLRSRNDFDVSAVAASFGGGGHAQAASFRVATDAPINGPRPPREGPWFDLSGVRPAGPGKTAGRAPNAAQGEPGPLPTTGSHRAA